MVAPTAQSRGGGTQRATRPLSVAVPTRQADRRPRLATDRGARARGAGAPVFCRGGRDVCFRARQARRRAAGVVAPWLVRGAASAVGYRPGCARRQAGGAAAGVFAAGNRNRLQTGARVKESRETALTENLVNTACERYLTNQKACRTPPSEDVSVPLFQTSHRLAPTCHPDRHT